MGGTGHSLAISRIENNILIKHEWMDVERIIHMEQVSSPDGTEPSIMGYSVGRFEGDDLIIETSHFTQGCSISLLPWKGSQCGGCCIRTR